MADASKSVKNRIQNVGNQLETAAGSAAATFAAVADEMNSRTQDFIADAAERAEYVGSYVSQRAEDATVGLGSRMKAAGAASEAMARRLKESGSHLEKDGIEGLCADVTTLIKSNPIAATLTGVAFGFLMARIVYHRES